MEYRDDIFHLIKSLSGPEKRYFRLFAARHKKKEDAQSLALFDCIQAMDQFEPLVLKRKLAGRPLLRQLPVALADLAESVLKALSLFHQEGTYELLINRQFSHSVVLISKRQFPLALRTIRKGKRIALHYDKFHFAMEFARLEAKVIKAIVVPDLQRELDLLKREEDQYIHLLATEAALRKVHDRLFALMHNAGIDNPILKSEIKQIRKNEWIQINPAAFPFSLQIIFHFCHAYLHLLLNEFDAVFSRFEKMIRLWEANPHWLDAEPERYVQTFITLLEIASQAGREREFRKFMKMVSQLKAQNTSVAPLIHFRAATLQFTFLQAEGRQPDVLAFESEIVWGLKQFDRILGLPVRLGYYFNLCAQLFYHGEFARALKWASQILNQQKKEARTDISDFAAGMRIILLIEMNEFTGLEYFMQAARRRWKRQPPEQQPMSFLLKNLPPVRRLEEGLPSGEWAALFRRFTEAFSGPRSAALGVPEIAIWLEARSLNLSPKALFNQKNSPQIHKKLKN